MVKRNCEQSINGVICNSEMKYFSNCPRLGLGWYLCPNCNEKEYQRYFPTKEQMCENDIQDIYKKIINELNHCEDKKLVLQGLISKLILIKLE